VLVEVRCCQHERSCRLANGLDAVSVYASILIVFVCVGGGGVCVYVYVGGYHGRQPATKE